jgi:hypothetical protein
MIELRYSAFNHKRATAAKCRGALMIERTVPEDYIDTF